MVIQQNSRKLLMMDIKSELKRSWSVDCSFSYFASIGLNFCEPHLAVGTQLTRSELKTILLTCFNSIMNSDGGNLMICAYFLHPNILYLTLIILIMKTKECHWDTAFVSCIGSPMNNREPCGRARVLGQARDRERERASSLGIGLISIQRASPLPTPINQSSPSPTNHQNINY